MLHLCGLKRYLPVVALPVFAVLMQIPLQADPVTVTSTVSSDGGNYLYDFAVTNLSSSDPYSKLIDVSISVTPGSIVGNAMTPTGFEGFIDSASGSVDFAASSLSGFPLDQTVSGFQFLSSAQLSPLPFTANYLNSAETAGTSFSGTTFPVSSSTVPEPRMAGVFIGALLILVCRSLRVKKLNAAR